MAKSNGQDLDLSNFMGEWGVDFFMAREHDPRERQRERGGGCTQYFQTSQLKCVLLITKMISFP